MIAKVLKITIIASLMSLTALAAEERVVQVQNRVRAGFDDNVNLVDESVTPAGKVETGFISEILTINGKLNFSDRTDAHVYWQPEIQIRFDDDADSITKQDVYGRLSHAISQRVSLELSDRLRYMEREAQQTTIGTTGTDRNYLENDLQGALTYTVSDVGAIRVGGGYEFRAWDEKDYGKSNDYNRVVASGLYQHELKPDTTTGSIGVMYTDHEYENSRGYDSVTVYAGLSQSFSPEVTGFGQVGVSANNVDSGGDSTTPYARAGVDYSATEQTSVNASLGYSTDQTENAEYSAQDRLSLSLGLGHDVTGKIRLSSTASYVMSEYSADYSAPGVANLDKDEGFLALNVRASYQINRNNFIEAGIQYSDRAGDLSEYDRTVADIGWRLRL